MREIKFRAWDTFHKKMCFGYEYAIPFDGGTVINHKAGIDFVHQLIPMQYTGLLDKEGKEIWEGDILSNSRVNPRIYLVKWEDFGGRFIGDSGMITIWAKDFNMLKNIGNVHQNPELLTTPQG